MQTITDRLRSLLTLTLVLTGWYLYAFPAAVLPYAVAIIAHVVLGIGLAVLLVPPAMRALVLATAYGATYARVNRWKNAYRIANPGMPPQAMQVEGLGQSGPFFPSSVRTPDGHTIKSSFFMDSKACERCHSDIYHQW